MISGGTSVVSMYNIIQSMLSVPDNKNEVALLYTTHTKEFIVLQKEFE
jgi:NAD(P)H-flavin reductase